MDSFIPQVRKYRTARMHGVRFGLGDQRLYEFAQRLGLRHGRRNSLVKEQRRGQVREQRIPVGFLRPR